MEKRNGSRGEPMGLAAVAEFSLVGGSVPIATGLWSVSKSLDGALFYTFYWI